MDIKVSEFQAPSKLPKTNEVILLPAEFETSLTSATYHSNTLSFGKYLRGKVDFQYLNEPTTLVEQRSEDWYAPALLLVSHLALNYPLTVSIICNLISSYLYDIFKGKKPPKVHLTLICERTDAATHLRFDYSGEIEGLAKLPDVVRETLSK